MLLDIAQTEKMGNLLRENQHRDSGRKSDDHRLRHEFHNLSELKYAKQDEHDACHKTGYE